MPSCLKCGTALALNEEGVAPVLCDRCAGVATGRARRSMAIGGLGRYPVTVGLFAINVIVFVLQQVPGLNVTYWGTNIGPLTLTGEYWRLFTAGFLHGGIFHIAVNMWCLWSLGRLSERLFGKWQTFAIYMLTGVGGALLSIASNPNHAELGASGAIFGIVGAVMAGVKFGDLNISAGEKRAIFSSVVSFAVLNFILGFSGFGSSVFGRVDNMCHLGGFVSGLLVGLPLGAFARRHQLLQLATVVVTGLVLFAAGRELVQTYGPAAQKRIAMMEAERGNYLDAAQYLEKYTADDPHDEEALLDLGKLYVLTNQRDKAINAFQRALKANPNSYGAKEALEGLEAPLSPDKK
ncbi:MAG TPA: rhomboid family intramembrane serine protease [Candidatus Angelobacter sp.]|nr:rhomboid family intramembrane serine protease [Candidatus Angelobacter sp.]